VSATSPEQIAERAREDLEARLRAAFEHQLAARPLAAAPVEGQLEELVDAAARRAGAVLWRRCLAGAAADAFGIGLAEALSHPAVQRAHELVGAPAYEPATVAVSVAAPDAGPRAVRLAAVHLGGIESLANGESDLELRFSDAGLDVLKGSSGVGIGRLAWSEIRSVSFSPGRRGLRGGRRQELHVETVRGRVSFHLPGMSDRRLREQLEPLLAQWRPGE
jgi:hypothetical protein